jgi:multidrug transporter EmrE-like cation transporter
MIQKIAYGMLIGALAQILTFFQLQGQFKYQWMKDNQFITSLIGIPISYLFISSVKYIVSAYDGELWPSRLIGYGVGVIVFIAMSKLWFGEPVTLKTLTCLLLSIAIILIQLFWRS